MGTFAYLVIGALVGLSSLVAQADSLCDCTKVIGQCVASVKITSVSGSAPSYTANYSITSTAPRCSKVSYFLDSTPYFNILSATNSEQDSTYSTSPISAKSFSGVKCEVCASSANSPGSTAASIDESAKKFVGVWQGTMRWGLFSDDTTISIESANGRLGGSSSNEHGTVRLTSVRVSGRTLVYSFVGQDQGTYTYQMSLISDGVAKISSADGGLVNFSGTLRKVQ